MKPFTLARNLIYSIGFKMDKTFNSVSVLCYHSISNDNWQYSISKEMFCDQIKSLQKTHTFICSSTIPEIISGKYKSSNKPLVAIHFDDGYQDILEIKDFIKSLGIRPTLFVLSNPENSDEQQLGTNLQKLSDEEIKSLLQDGWELGSHGATHGNFWKMSRQQLGEEIIGSKEKLQNKFGCEVKYFSFPRGRYNLDALEAVKKAGYKLAFTMDDDFIDVKSDLYTIPRIGIDKTHTPEQFEQTISKSAVIIRKFIKNFAGGIFRRFI